MISLGNIAVSLKDRVYAKLVKCQITMFISHSPPRSLAQRASCVLSCC